MNSPVVSSLVPVVLLIAAGYVAGRLRWIGGAAVKDLSNLIFLLLAPALLFRSMSTVHLEQLSLRPVAAYFLGAGIIFAATLAIRGFNPTSAVLALSNTYSNTVMIGIPLVGLAYGAPGTVVLLTLVSLHSLVLLTSATVVLELAVARQHPEAGDAGGAGRRQMAATVLRALRNAIIHPVCMPVIAGLLFAQTGWTLPEPVDRPLALLGAAFGPVALVMVGITLALTPVGRHLREAVGQSLIKNFAHPAMVALLGWLLGVRGVALTVMVVAAALPMGANLFMFAQRYGVAEELVTASVVVSTVLALATLTAAMALAAHF